MSANCSVKRGFFSTLSLRYLDDIKAMTVKVLNNIESESLGRWHTV